MEVIEQLGQVALALKKEFEEEQKWMQWAMQHYSPQQRRDKGITWYPVKLVEDGYGFGDYPFLIIENPRSHLKHQFQSGAPVSVFSMADASKEERISGVIGFVDDARMKISFTVDELPDWLDNGKVGVDLLMDEKSFREMFKAMNEVINAASGPLAEIRDVIYGKKNQTWTEYHLECSLNESQRKGVELAMGASHCALLHGPPGTGKTTTLVTLIQNLSRHGLRVLFCAPSNAAVDHGLRKCVEAGLTGVRVGNMAKIGEENTSLTLDAALTRDKEYKQVKELKKRALEMRKMGRKYKRKFGREEAEQRRLLFQEAKSLGKEACQLEEYLSQRILETAQVIATTLIGTTHFSLSQIKFDVVVMDEAAQALEPAAWVAIQHAPKVIMAGDPFQLPPTVKSREAEKMGLTCTLMEKAMKVLGTMGYLTEQYRMHQQIMGFSNAYFYHNRLTAHESVALHEVGNGLPPLVFLDTAGCGYEEKSDGEDGSKSNPEEAALVLKHAERWLNEVDCSVAVISPYRAQVEYMEEHSALRPNYKINTIDSFQGQEADVVYISLVRSNAKGEIGFLKDYRRMNVAMTRARKSLVVIGDSATLAKDRFYEQFLNYVEEHGSYSSAWEYVD